MAKKQKTLEEQLRRLEEIRLELEHADRPIEELLRLYEEGITIAKSVRHQLQQVRQRIVTLAKQLSDDESTPPTSG